MPVKDVVKSSFRRCRRKDAVATFTVFTRMFHISSDFRVVAVCVLKKLPVKILL